MAVIAPTVQKVTHGIRKIAKSLLQNRKSKVQSRQNGKAVLEERDVSPLEASSNENSADSSAEMNSTAPATNKNARSAKNSKRASGQKLKASAPASKQPVNPTGEKDPAHQPGHRKMNLKSEFQEATGTKSKSQNQQALNHMSGSDKVKRTTSPHRRIINGSGTLGSKSAQGRSRKAH